MRPLCSTAWNDVRKSPERVAWPGPLLGSVGRSLRLWSSSTVPEVLQEQTTVGDGTVQPPAKVVDPEALVA